MITNNLYVYECIHIYLFIIIPDILDVDSLIKTCTLLIYIYNVVTDL